MIRVVLPAQLRSLAGVEGEVVLPEGTDATAAGVVDALERAYPTLRGTIRDPRTASRRPYLRFYADEEDLSFEPSDAPLPESVKAGREPFIVLGAISGG